MKVILSAIITALLILSTHPILAKEYRKTFSVQPDGKLELETVAGTISVTSHALDTVFMQVETQGLDEGEFILEHELSGSDVSIIAKLRDKKRWYRAAKVNFTLTVPKRYNLDIQTSGGSIYIDNLVGDVEAKTSGGEVSAEKIAGEVSLHTSGGSISVDAIQGPLSAHTSGGSIKAKFPQQLREDADLNTSGGSVVAYLSKDIQVDLNAYTSGGRVRSEFSVEGRVKRQSIRGKINGGGPGLKLHTSGGSISIKTL